MRIAIMQPYFLPYVGYFQLMNAVDVFVVYDNIKYTKKGWINRNRFLKDLSDALFSIPLKKDSDYLNVNQRRIAEDFDRAKLLNQIRATYRNAPCFDTAFAIFKAVVMHQDRNLFRFIRHSLEIVSEHLGVRTPVINSSSINIDHSQKKQNKVLAICEALDADTYVNAIGGRSLYSTFDFAERGIELGFIESKPFKYAQFTEPFIPWLSILDVMMFNRKDETAQYLANGYSLIGLRESSVV